MNAWITLFFQLNVSAEHPHHQNNSLFSPHCTEHVCCWWSHCRSAITQVCFWVSILRCSCTTRGILFHRALSGSHILFLRRTSQIWRKKIIHMFPCVLLEQGFSSPFSKDTLLLSLNVPGSPGTRLPSSWLTDLVKGTSVIILYNFLDFYHSY